MKQKTLQIIGPFITNYSFARVNRGLAEALSKVQDEYKIYLYQSREKIDKWPEDSDLALHPEVKDLWSKESLETDVALYNDFPKTGNTLHDLANLPGKTKIAASFAWEESVYPEMWVNEINENLHGMTVTASFVREIFRKAGIKIPIEVVWNGLDKNVRQNATGKYPLDTKKSFKFLHISSARKRKGIDVLLKAYFAEFSKKDDCALVIKSFPGPENLVNELLSELMTENSPEVIHIFNPDLTDQELTNLIETCDASVYPSRAEGFGIPIAESMYHGKPVIATNYSGYLDFANEDNAFLIDYELKDAVDSEMVNIGAKWAEPDQKDLQEKMRYLYENYQSSVISDQLLKKPAENREPACPVGRLKTEDSYNLIQQKIQLAKEAVDALTWENAAKKTFEFIKQIEKVTDLKNKNFAVISPLNSEDGIAKYTSYLYSKIEHSFKNFYYISNSDIADRTETDAENVKRLWESGETAFEKTLEFIKENNINIVHIQYHSGFNYPIKSLDLLIQKLKELNVKVFVTLHAAKGPTFNLFQESKSLKLADKVLIHNEEDFVEGSKFLNNLIHFPHPREEYKKRNKEKLRTQLNINSSPIIASHGLMNQSKNIPKILKVIAELKKEYPNILYLGLHAVSSNNLSSESEFEKCLKLVEELNLEDNAIFFKEFLNEEQIEILLETSDINILAYSEAGESASGAVSKCLASMNPTIVTDIKMFNEFKDEVYKIKEVEVGNISTGIKELLNNAERKNIIVGAAKKYINKNSYEKKSVELLEIYADKENLI